MVNNKDKYKYVRIHNPSGIKQKFEESDLYISESIKKADVFAENRKQQLKMIDSSNKIIESLLVKIDKLDKLLHEKAI